MIYYDGIVASVLKPWNLMYYNNEPTLKVYLENLTSNGISFREKKSYEGYDSTIRDFEIFPEISYTDFDGLTKNSMLTAHLTAYDSGHLSMMLKDKKFFLEILYESLQIAGGYIETTFAEVKRITNPRYPSDPSGPKVIYNSEKHIGVYIRKDFSRLD